MRAPQAAGKGMAQVALSFDAWKEGQVKPARVEVPVDVGARVKASDLLRTR